jgi:hypothetical protein
LRDSIAGLPEWADSSWHHGQFEDGTIVDATGWVLWRLPGGAPVAGHIALTASPDITEALADLLEALADMTANVRPRALALAAAIERQET